MVSALQALERLREGNRRFVAEVLNGGLRRGSIRREELTEVHEPFAIVLGCSDARVPAEIVFDQGIGDLFVIRVAGNVVAPSQIGSIEFAAARFGTRLVVVLGHSQCGAVEATLAELERPGESRSPNLAAIVNRIRPAVDDLVVGRGTADRKQLMKRAVRANCRASVAHLRHGSDILERLIEREGLMIVGAEYSLETGEVDFFETAPGGA